MRLRWTHRLKDYFVEENIFVQTNDQSVATFCAIREAELICEDDVATATENCKFARTSEAAHHHHKQNVSREDPPTFDQFCRCYDGRSVRLFLSKYDEKSFLKTCYLAKPEFRVADTSLDTMAREGVKFCILWLTETIFISSVHWTSWSHRDQIYDYQITLTPWHSSEAIVVHVYTLSSFGGLKGPRREAPPSLDPISFLASMATQQRDGYFRKVRVQRRNDISIPLEKFLEIIPTNKDKGWRRPPHSRALTLVEFFDAFRLQDIVAALSYCEEHNVAVRHFLHLKELDTNVNAVLRECPHLHHIDIRGWIYGSTERLLRINLEKGEIPFTENHHIESITIEISFWKDVSPFLKGAAVNRGLKHLYIMCRYWQESLLQDVALFLGSLSKSSSLQEIIVACPLRPFSKSQPLSKILDARCVSSATKLHHFSVVAAKWNEDSFWAMHGFDKAMVNSDVWDRLDSPRLSLNWYSNYLAQRQERRPGSRISAAVKETIAAVVPWKVRAVNLGIVYHKTTYHTPHDMSTANATVLFALLYNDIIL
jgi:hypothetical protein